MSLDVYLKEFRPTEVFEANITHNLGKMAAAVDLYEPLWRPENLGIKKAHQLVPFLITGLERLREMEARCRQLEPENGWGRYETLVDFTEKYLKACRENPYADVGVSR